MKTTTFLKLLLLCIFALIYGVIFSNSGNTLHHLNLKETIQDSTICLKIKGCFSKTNDNVKNACTVELLLDNRSVEMMKVLEGGAFKFSLKKNQWYTVKITEEGHEPKLILFNTEISPIYDNYVYVLSFDIDELLTEKESKELDSDILDFPIALFAFDSRFAEFNFNEEYRTNILRKLFEPIIAKNN